MISKKKEKEIIKFIENNQPKIDWYGEYLDDGQVKEILERGLDSFYDRLFEVNLDYISDLEYSLLEYINEEFELKAELEDIYDNFIDYMCVDLNINKLLDKDITCLAVVYSNYDCTTSWQSIDEPEEYLGAVWQRVKHFCNKKDYINEFANSYTASLLCFAFKMDLKSFIEIKENFKESIFIPKGTQYSFFSSFNGSGGMFEARTTKDVTLPKFEPNQTEYDCIDLLADVEQSYSIKAVYGDDSFIDYQNVTVK